MTRISALAILLLALAGCTTATDPLLTASIPASAPASTTEVPAQFALAYLPGSGNEVLAVGQTLTRTGASQRIVLSNTAPVPGENFISILVGPSADAQFRKAPDQSDIAREMRSAMPGVAMSLSPGIGENAYGVFGAATGSTGASGSCLYAWQLITNIDPAARGGKSLVSGSKPYAARIRVRICQLGAAAGDLASLMQGLRVKPVTGETLAILRLGGQTAIAATLPEPARTRPAVAAKAAPAKAARLARSEPSSPATRPASQAVLVPMPDSTPVDAATVAMPAT